VEDDTIGLYFYNSRFYDPSLGRFIQADTIVPNPSDPQDLNRYSYVRNNPLRYTDPSGHWYYDPGHQALVKTKDPTHENAIDPVSTKYRGPGRYLNYDETWQSSPIQPIMPQDAGAAYCEAASCANLSPVSQAERWGVRLDVTIPILPSIALDLNVEFTWDIGTTFENFDAHATLSPEVGVIPPGFQASGGVVVTSGLPEDQPLVSFMQSQTSGGSVPWGPGIETDITTDNRTGDITGLYLGGGPGTSWGVYHDFAPLSLDLDGWVSKIFE